MSITTHNGAGVALMNEPIDPSEKCWLWFCWYDMPQTSTWILPAGWTVHDEKTNVNVVTDAGKALTHCNGVLLSTIDTKGNHFLTNRVTFSNGETISRTVQVKVRLL